MSDTPRTDEVIGKITGAQQAFESLSKHSRDLERENADLKKQLAEARDKALEDAATLAEIQYSNPKYDAAAAIRQLKGQS